MSFCEFRDPPLARVENILLDFWSKIEISVRNQNLDHKIENNFGGKYKITMY